MVTFIETDFIRLRDLMEARPAGISDILLIKAPSIRIANSLSINTGHNPVVFLKTVKQLLWSRGFAGRRGGSIIEINSSLLGKVVKITFLDHADGEGLVKCQVVGEVREAGDERLVLCRWVVLDENEETTRNNEEFYTIVTAAIKDIKVATFWEL